MCCSTDSKSVKALGQPVYSCSCFDMRHSTPSCAELQACQALDEPTCLCSCFDMLQCMRARSRTAQHLAPHCCCAECMQCTLFEASMLHSFMCCSTDSKSVKALGQPVYSCSCFDMRHSTPSCAELQACQALDEPTCLCSCFDMLQCMRARSRTVRRSETCSAGPSRRPPRCRARGGAAMRSRRHGFCTLGPFSALHTSRQQAVAFLAFSGRALARVSRLLREACTPRLSHPVALAYAPGYLTLQHGSHESEMGTVHTHLGEA